MIGANLTNCAVMYKKWVWEKLIFRHVSPVGGHNSDFRKQTLPVLRDRKEFIQDGNPFSFSLKHFCDTTLQSNLGCCCFVLFFFFTSGWEKKRLKKMWFMNGGAFTRTNTTLITDPQLGWLLKNKMHLACIQPVTKCDFHLETLAAFRCAGEDERGTQAAFLSFLFCFLLNGKALECYSKKSRLCYKCVSQRCGGGAEPAFITSLHIVMRVRRRGSEQRKPDLRAEVFF